VVVFIVPLK